MSSDTSSAEELHAEAGGPRPARAGVPLRAPLLALAAVLSMSGCGLAGTAATAAAGGASEAEQARQAKATEDRVKQQLDDATRAAAQQREAAEQAAQ